MPTRNLYEIPDVCATLLIAIAERNDTLIASAAHELIQSGLNPMRALLFGWFLSPPEPEASKACYLAYLSNNVEHLLHALKKLRAYDLPPLPPLPPKPAAYTIVEKGVAYAVKNRNFMHAAYLTSALLGSKELHSILKCEAIQLLNITEFQPLQLRILQHLFAALVFDGEPVVLTNPLRKEKGRCFKVNPRIYSIWGLKPRSPSRLLGLPLHIMEEDASPFWKDQVKKFQIVLKNKELQFPDDEAVERFYEENFPNDIPDEWSIAERAKSHPPITQTGEAETVWATGFKFVL